MAGLTNRPFGCLQDGTPVTCWTLSNARGMEADILTYGGILRALRVPAPDGLRDVVLGFDRAEDYERNAGACLGALVGRVANRIGGARFSLDGKEYRLAVNNGPNCLHGGLKGFHTKLWSAGPDGRGGLALTLESPDGEECFPGRLSVRVTYALTVDNALSITYEARTSAPTPVNLTNHSYFNLDGQGTGTVERHSMQIFADYITQNSDTSVPTGVLLGVGGTPFDLREPKPLGPGLESDHPQIAVGHGYDHNFVLSDLPCRAPTLAAVAESAGLRLECLTTQPGVQLYTANFLDAACGKDGAAYPPRSGFCLETQSWPDAVNHPDFPTTILHPGEVYSHQTIYRFSAGGL